MNRGNILRLLKSVPSLEKVTTKDNECVSFLQNPEGRQPITLLTVDTASIANQIMQEQEIFHSWGITISQPAPKVYPTPFIKEESPIKRVKGIKDDSVFSILKNPLGETGCDEEKSVNETKVEKVQGINEKLILTALHGNKEQ